MEQLTAEELDHIGGCEYIRLLTLEFAASNPGYYAKIIREKSIMRQAIEAGSLIAQRGYEQHGSAKKFLAEAEQRSSAMREAVADKDGASAFCSSSSDDSSELCDEVIQHSGQCS